MMDEKVGRQPGGQLFSPIIPRTDGKTLAWRRTNRCYYRGGSKYCKVIVDINGDEVVKDFVVEKRTRSNLSRLISMESEFRMASVLCNVTDPYLRAYLKTSF